MNNIKPKISVCIPTYNRSEYIKNTIDSVLDQTFTNFELLICIDGSTDKTEEIISQYHDERIKVYKNKKNIGYIRTMHKLAKLSTSSWIQFLSDDDLLHKEYLEKCWRIIKEEPKIGFVVTAINFIDDKGEYIQQKKKEYISKEDFYEELKNTIVFPPKEMLGNFTMMSIPMLNGKYKEVLPTAFPAHIFNKKVLKAVGESDSELFYNHDTLQVSKISVISPCAYIDEALLDYRIHNNLSKKAGESVEFVRQYFMFIDKFNNFLRMNKIVIPNIEEQLTSAFEKNFFSLNGHLLRIASKIKDRKMRNENISNNLSLVYDRIPGSKYKLTNNLTVLLSYNIHPKVIERLGYIYFKYIKQIL